MNEYPDCQERVYLLSMIPDIPISLNKELNKLEVLFNDIIRGRNHFINTYVKTTRQSKTGEKEVQSCTN